MIEQAAMLLPSSIKGQRWYPVGCDGWSNKPFGLQALWGMLTTSFFESRSTWSWLTLTTKCICIKNPISYRENLKGHFQGAERDRH